MLLGGPNFEATPNVALTLLAGFCFYHFNAVFVCCLYKFRDNYSSYNGYIYFSIWFVVIR